MAYIQIEWRAHKDVSGYCKKRKTNIVQLN
ncbi:MAG: hypothetical protein H6Q19_1530 [Bacteroidetes bacterium]|nr:hypothetical protein [Bacteroidota bacterium]